uniref:Uncharacterized protein n=1 Tax=Glossina morsitans morsitans TaxID=37546 RepID=A0ABK9NG05_GLOMM
MEFPEVCLVAPIDKKLENIPYFSSRMSNRVDKATTQPPWVQISSNGNTGFSGNSIVANIHDLSEIFCEQKNCSTRQGAPVQEKLTVCVKQSFKFKHRLKEQCVNRFLVI